METTLQKLYCTLGEQLDHYKSFLEMLQEERRAMIEMDLDTMNLLQAEKEKALLAIRRTEGQRMAAVSELAAALGRPVEGLTTSMIADVSPEPWASKLRYVQSTLRSLLETIKELNQLNGGLATLTLRGLNQSSAYLNKLMNPTALYTRQGGMQQGLGAGRLVAADV